MARFRSLQTMVALVLMLSCKGLWNPPAIEPVARGGQGGGEGGQGGAGGEGGADAAAVDEPDASPLPPATGDAAGPVFEIPDARAEIPPPPAAGEPGAKTCGTSTHTLERLPPAVLLVLDRSASMIENKVVGPVCQTRACGTRWTEVTSAMSAALQKTQTNIDWGVKTYPDDSACLVGDDPSVPVGPANATAIISHYASVPPIVDGGYTPTREAVRKGGAYLRGLGRANPKFLLLATDGEPNCGAGGTTVKDAAASVQAVADVAAAGIPVFVVGVSTANTTASATLNEMAVKGGRPRSDPTTKYYPAETAEDLTAALAAIGAQIASCTFALGQAPPVPDNVAVRVNGVRVPHDPAGKDGWDYGPDTKTIALHGDACKAVQSAGVTKVEMIFGCPDEVVE